MSEENTALNNARDELSGYDTTPYRLPTFRGVRLNMFTKDELMVLIMQQMEMAEKHRQDVASRLI